jgi:two-component system, OmpR family, sensor histidine kinase KdpD
MMPPMNSLPATPARGGRILVCVNEDPAAAGVIRHGSWLAERSAASWTALYVESIRYARLSESERDEVAQSLRLAEQLGGEALTVPGGDIVEEILRYARENGVTQIVIGKSRRSRRFELVHGSVARELLRRAGDLDIHVLAGGAGGGAATAQVATRGARPRFEPIPYLVTLGFLAIATAFGISVRDYTQTAGAVLLYLLVVVSIAVSFGLGPSLLASFIAMLCFDFFFSAPLYSLAMTDPREIAVLVVFSIVAIITSNLAARTRAQVLMARGRAKTTAELYAFSRQLAGIAGLAELLTVAATRIAEILQLRTIFLMRERGALVARASAPAERELGAAEHDAAEWAWRNGRAAGYGTEHGGALRWLFLPVATTGGTVAVLGIARDPPDALLTPDERRLLNALLDQSGIAIERILLAAQLDETRVLRETERLRAALLTSLSHDLRTPLASVLGTLTSLRSFDRGFDQATRDELLATAQEEAERLSRFVDNLLDMTRLEAGALEARRDAVDLGDIVGSAARHAGKVLGRRKLRIAIAPDLPMLRLDFVLLEQALVNLLDNAAKYAPPETPITIAAARTPLEVRLTVSDEGIGIPPEDLERIFDKFYRVKAGDHQRAGTGLGLAICRGFIEAQGGTITAGNRTDRGGAVFTIAFPIAGPGSLAVEEAELPPGDAALSGKMPAK